MWNRTNFVRKVHILYLSNVQQAPKLSHQENVKLTQRFLEYFQEYNSKNSQQLISKNSNNLNNVRGLCGILQLDKSLSTKASEMSSKEIFKHLTVFMTHSPSKVTEFDFYNISKSILLHRIEELTPQELVQLMYAVALKKKSYDATRYMKKCMAHLNSHPELIKSFTLTDLLVLCNATFKTSTRIHNKELLKMLQDILLNNLNILEDTGMLVTLVKSLRHNECQNEEMLATMSAAIFFNKTYKKYSFTAICHILPLYADYLYYDEELFNLFANCAMEHLKHSEIHMKHEYFVDNIRVKDIKRFLWSCSSVGHRLKHKELKLIEEMIYERIVHGHFDEEPHTLFDCVYYLWMQEYQSEKLLESCKDKIEVIRGMANKTKIRVNMLLVCMQIENAQLYKSFGHKIEIFKSDVKKEVVKRPGLVKVYNVLQTFMSDLDVNRLEYEFQVPHFNILAITGYRKNVYKAFIVEVLDKTNMLKNCEEKGNGRMQTKLKLMYKMDLTVVILNSDVFEELNDLELRDYIRKEMSIVS